MNKNRAVRISNIIEMRHPFAEKIRDEYSHFISGEILRQFSDCDFRSNFCKTPDDEWNFTNWTFPKK